MTLGDRENFQTESAVQLKYNAIPSTVLTLFGGRLTNILEHKLVGQLGSSGPCRLQFHFTTSLSFALSINKACVAVLTCIPTLLIKSSQKWKERILTTKAVKWIAFVS